MKMPTELYTVETLFSFQGMSTFVYVVISGWTPQGMKKWKKWIALALAEVVSLSGTMFLPVPGALGYFIAVANGFMIAATAIGMSSIATATYATPRLADRFFESWF